MNFLQCLNDNCLPQTQPPKTKNDSEYSMNQKWLFYLTKHRKNIIINFLDTLF